MIRNLLAPSLKAYQLHGVHVLTELHIFPTLPVCNVPAKWSLWLCPILGSKIVLKLLQNEWLKWPSTLECRATFLKHTTVHIFFCAKLSRYFLPERKKTRSFWIGNRVLVSLTVLLMTRKQPTKVLLTGYDILSEKFRANNNNK